MVRLVLAGALLAGAAVHAAEAGAAADAKVRAALRREFAFDYDDLALDKAIADIRAKTGVEIVCDPQAFSGGGGAGVPVTWASRKCSAERALRWVTRLVELDFAVEDGAVFVSTREGLRGRPYLEVYDVRDVSGLARRQWFGPALGFEPPSAPRVEEEEFGESSIAEMIQCRIMPESWAAELGTSIEERDGLLVAVQWRHVHEEIRRLLEKLRERPRRGVRVEVIAVRSDAALGLLKAARAGGVERSAVERAAGAEGALVARCEIATLDGLAAFVLSGSKRHYVASKELVWPVAELPDRTGDHVDYEVIDRAEDSPGVLVVKTPAPAPAPPAPGEGVLVPVTDALLDGWMVEARPRLALEGDRSELELRIVYSRPHAEQARPAPAGPGGPGGPGGQCVETPSADYSTLATTLKLRVGRFGLVGRMAIRRGPDEMSVLVFALVEPTGG